MKVNLKQCSAVIRASAKDKMTSAEADSLVEAVERRLENVKEDEIINAEEKAAEIGEELMEEIDKFALIEKRNALMTIRAMRSIKKNAKTYDSLYEGLLGFLEDSRRKVEGAGRGVNAVIEGWKSKYLGELKSRLIKADVYEEFRKDTLEKEIFQEFYSPGSSGSKKARIIRDIMFSLKQDLVEKQNRHGSFINFLPEHVKRQSYSQHLIKKKFGPARFNNVLNINRWLTPKEYEATFLAWKNFIKPLLDTELTFKDSNADSFLRGAFDGIMSGKHGPMVKANGAQVNAKFFKAGSLAKKASVDRILHFKDGESSFAAHKAFSSDPLSHGFLMELEHSSTNLGLMQMMGPNPERALTEVIDELAFEYSRKGDEKQVRDLQENKSKLITALKFLNGEARIPENPTLQTAVASISSVISQAKLGRIVLFAIPDRVLLQSTLTRNGVKAMDALSAALKLTKPANKADRLRLMNLGAEVRSFVSSVNGRFSTGAEGHIPSGLNKSQNLFFEFSGINYMDNIGTASVLQALTRQAGNQSDLPWEKLIPEFREMLSKYGFRADEWDTIRATGYSVDSKGTILETRGNPRTETENWITPDRFADIPEAQLNKLLDLDGLKNTDTNRKKKVDELESKFRSWLTGQRDEAVLIPGSKEHRLAAWGTQAGTPLGSTTRLLMLFKSFPITMYTKIIRREIQGNGARNFQDWAKAEKNSNYHTMQLVSMMTIAGYLSLTIQDLLEGKEPRRLVDDRGNFDGEKTLSVLRDSFLRGGAGSIYGDLLLRQYDNSYNTVARSVGGPVLGEVEKLAAMAQDAATGELKGVDAYKFVKGNTPWLNMFYIKPALDMLLFNNIQEMLDPGSLRRIERENERRGANYFIKPSETNQ
jgi:hypothetical protein